jgi:hypothetical protein
MELWFLEKGITLKVLWRGIQGVQSTLANRSRQMQKGFYDFITIGCYLNWSRKKIIVPIWLG